MSEVDRARRALKKFDPAVVEELVDLHRRFAHRPRFRDLVLEELEELGIARGKGEAWLLAIHLRACS